MKKTILLLFCISLGLIGNSQEGKIIDEVIAVVGDEIVTKSELESQLMQIASQGMSVNDKLRCQVLEELLFQKLLLNQAKVDSIEITDAQVNSELDRRMRYFINQIGSEEALEEYYKKPISKIKEEMRSSLKDQLLTQQMQAGITEGVKITPSEVQEYFDRIPEDSLPLINSTVELSEIVVFAPLSKQSKQAAKERLQILLDRVKDAEKFSTLAILYSEDKASAKKGGEIGFMGRAELEPEFSAAAFKLKPGGISPIIESKHGFHIIEMIERRGEKVNVRHILIQPKMEKSSYLKAEKKLDSIANLIAMDSLSFEEAAVQFSEREDSKNNEGLIVNPYSGSSKVDMDELDITLFTVIDQMEIGEISAPVILSDIQSKPGYRLIKLRNRTAPHRANLKDDYQKIKNAAIAEKEARVLNEWLENNVKSAYVKVSEDYSESCDFRNDWLNKNP